MRRKRGFSVHTRTSRLYPPCGSPASLSVFPLFLFSPSAAIALARARALSLSLLRLPLSGWWCGKSVVLTGTRWSTTLKAPVAVKEEGCTLAGKRRRRGGCARRERVKGGEGGGGGKGGLIVWYHDVFNLQAAIWSWLFMVVG